MDKKIIIKNYIYNLIYQFTVIILPIITIPYITRILGKEVIGIYAYTTAWVQYFITVALLGVNLNGSRSIAYVRTDKEKRSKAFFEIYSLQILTTLISLILFYIFVLVFSQKYKLIMLLQSTLIIASLFDISWFFIGLEDFKKTVSRSLIAKILSVLSMFIFVKTSGDLWKLVTIFGIMNFIGNITMWTFLPKQIDFYKESIFNFNSTLKQFKKNLTFFIPQIIVQVYSFSDRTLLGILSTVSVVGVYDMANKIVRMIMPFIVSFSQVMMPRMSNIFATNDIKQIEKFAEKSFKFLFFISFPIALGLFAVSDTFVHYFLGKDFAEVAILLKIICFAIIALTIGSITGTQLLIPTGKQNFYTVSVFSGFIINLVINILLIPKLGALAAAISFLITEFVVSFIQFYFVREYIKISSIIKDISKSALASIFMLFILLVIKNILGATLVSLVVQIFVGLIVYACLTVIIKCELAFEVLNKIKKLIRKRNLERIT